MIENILKIVQLEAKWLALESSKDALQDKEKMNEIKEIQVSAKKAFSEITQNHSKTSVAEALQDSKLRSSLFKMYGRIFSRLAMNTQQMSKEERNLLIAVLENATKVFEIVSEVHINAQRGNSNPAQSVMDDLLSISLSVAMVFEDLKDRFLPSHSNNKQSDKHPSDRPARESEEVWEYLLDLVFDFMSLFFQASEKILTVSEFGHWQENLRRGVLSQLVLTSLLFATAQPATLPRSSVNWNRTSFKAVKLLHSLHLLFSTTRPSSPAPTTTITSFWRRSFPGFFSIIFNCITREKRSNMSEVRSVQWNYFMTLTLLNLLLTISRDDLSENQILLASQPASSPSTSSAVVFRTFLQSLPNKPPLADTQSEGDEPSTTLSPDKMDDVARITEFKSVEEMITWRVDLLQKLRQHLPSLLPALIAPLSLAQKREVERALLSLLTSATGFLGSACHDELLLTCWPPLVTERLLTNDPDDVTPVILLKSSPSLYERFRELLSSFLATSSSSSTSTNTQALTQQLATLLCLGGALEGSSSQSIGVTVTSVRGVTALFKIDVAAVRRALVFEEKSFHVRATSDVLEVTCAMCRFPWAIFAFAPQRATSSHSFDAENEEVARSLLRRLAVMVATSAHPSPSSFLEDFIAATERKLRHLLHAMTKKRVRRWRKTEEEEMGEGEQGGVEEVLNREISLIADDAIAHMHFLQYALFALLPRPHLFVFPRHRGLRESSEEKSDVTSALCCAYCGKKSSALPASLLRCARCKQSYYCDRQHQQLHWTSHKKHCKPPTTTSNTTSNTTTSQSSQSQHHVLKSRYFDPVRALQATATTTSSSSSSSETMHSLITPSSETVEIEGVQGVLTALIQLLRKCLEGRFLLLSLATSQQTERGRFHLFLAPLYSILVGKTLEVIADVSVLFPRPLITSLILPALLYEVVECRVAEEKIVSVMAENCLLRLALATHGADVHSTSSHSEMEREEVWRSSLLSALCTRHLDIFTNDVANIFREAHLLLHPVAPLAPTSSSSSSTSSTSFLLKYHPNDLHTSSQPLDRTALTQRALTFYLKHLLVHPSSPPQQRRRLFLLSKDLIEEVLKAVDLLPPHRSSSHFALTNTTAVLRECICLLPQLYLSTSSFSSSLLNQKRWRYVSINLPQLLPRTSSVHPLLSAIARHNKEKDSSDERKEATMTSASSLPPWHTSFLLFLRGVWGLTATDNDKEEKEEKSCDITHNTNDSDISDSEEEDDVRERSGDGVSVKEERQQLLHFLVSLQHRLTYFFSSSTSSEAMLAVQKNSAAAMTSVFLLLYLLSSSSGKRRVFEQQLHLLNTTFLTSLRHLHSLLRVKLAETPLTSHTVRLDFIDVDRQRVTLALHDQQQQRLAVTSLLPTRQSLSQGAAPSFEKLYLCSDVYDFYSLMMRLPDVTSFLSFRLAEEILPELCTTLLLCLKLYLTTIPDNNNDAINTPSTNTSSTSIAAKRFVRSEERVKLSLLHFLETCLQNEDFIVLFAPRSDVASQGMSSACDVVKSLIFYLLPLLACTESEEVTAVAYRIYDHLGSLDTAFLSLLFDFVLNDNVSASQSDWLLIARDTSLHHNISQSDAASSPVLSNSDITALLKKYQQDSGLLDKVLSIQETLLFKQPTLATPYPIDTIERHQLQVFSRLR